MSWELWSALGDSSHEMKDVVVGVAVVFVLLLSLLLYATHLC
jgi:Na+-transporting methylmalonyl-CoA/oxaloacetate decarboxylase gamma subunit